MTQALFQDRSEAGRVLARHLTGYAHRPDVQVLALPRGGVPVAVEVASALQAPLDVLVVRKLGVPGSEEYTMGAIARGVKMLNEKMIAFLRIDAEAIRAVVEREQAELQRRELAYRGERPALNVAGACVIVVDDGLATGATMRVALRALRAMAPARRVVAVPTAAVGLRESLREEADEVTCASTPDPFGSVGSWYRDFSQTSDEEVRRLLAAASSTVS